MTHLVLAAIRILLNDSICINMFLLASEDGVCIVVFAYRINMKFISKYGGIKIYVYIVIMLVGICVSVPVILQCSRLLRNMPTKTLSFSPPQWKRECFYRVVYAVLFYLQAQYFFNHGESAFFVGQSVLCLLRGSFCKNLLLMQITISCIFQYVYDQRTVFWIELARRYQPLNYQGFMDSQTMVQLIFSHPC